jgi:hypothetical protein
MSRNKVVAIIELVVGMTVNREIRKEKKKDWLRLGRLLSHKHQEGGNARLTHRKMAL